MPTARRDNEAGFVYYPDGRKGLLVAGGHEGGTSSEFLDIDTLVWESKAELPYQIQVVVNWVQYQLQASQEYP